MGSIFLKVDIFFLSNINSEIRKDIIFIFDSDKNERLTEILWL